MKVIYHAAAEAELIAAAQFYEQKLPGLGKLFLDEFDADIATILEAPARWRMIQGDQRRFLMKRFPYGLYYRIAGAEVRILVIKHHSQHPEHGMLRR